VEPRLRVSFSGILFWYSTQQIRYCRAVGISNGAVSSSPKSPRDLRRQSRGAKRLGDPGSGAWTTIPGMRQEFTSRYVVTSHDRVATDPGTANIRKLHRILDRGMIACSRRNGLLETFEAFRIDEKL
jgi:hypothetical protein